MSPEGKKSRTVEILDRRGENKRRNEDAKELLIVPRQQHIEKKLKRVSRYFLFRSPNFHSALFLRSFITDKWRVRACLPFGSQEFGFFFLCPGKRIEESLSTLFFVSSDFWFSSFNLHFSLGGCHLSAYTSCSPLLQLTHTTLTHKTFTHTHCPIPLILFVLIFFLALQ